MPEVLRIALDTGLFFIGCAAVFVIGIVVDARTQVRGPAPQRGRHPVRRGAGRRSVEAASVNGSTVSEPVGDPRKLGAMSLAGSSRSDH
jgi:hypothetical protein